MPDPSITIFDAYGTLFDVASPTARVIPDPALAARVGELWRNRQLEFAWTDAALGRPTDFWGVTQRALRAALEAVARADDPQLEQDLLAVYATLDAYPDAAPTLERLRQAGGQTYIYSNANDAMLDKSVAAAGLAGLLDGALSVDRCGHYKPDPRAYAWLCGALSRAQGDLRFVSSNAWDAAGAANAGLQAAWVNRSRASWPYDATRPPLEVTRLSELLGIHLTEHSKAQLER